MLLKVENLKKNYGTLKAVDGISFEVEKGDLIGLLGPNGAGKSTTISMISTLIVPNGGTISYGGKDIVKNPKAIQKHLGIVPQEIALYPTLSGMDNMKFWGKAYGLKGQHLKDRIEVVSEIIGIKDRLKDRVDKYSGGMKRRLNIGVALLHEPELLIMDEPTVGIDPQSRNHILETVKELNRQGMTIIYTSHYMEEVEFLCDKISIMDKGKVIASGTKEELLELVPHNELLTVTFDRIEDDLLGILKGIKGVSEVKRKENKVEMIVEENNILKRMIETLQDTEYEVLSIDIEKANLETVFLQLTGKALRD
ncbi:MULTISPECIES: ABC transporter ATP-binding protein [unclassified Fusibacter]|uniref:ABC transporter ATP-binding protein n=1 Tax=unclassified Fusibacter TaxID=2624464 RepID=UPI0010118754|nr:MULTISPECIES: ABC transporter ATP-binding protein [unclassified Fusibacter]MCK8059792.1 ABC transporter ATP-binding protein [Fusibacter sp. A2]NPE21593.1 ABC transporter ATP-binding protein [Fusibacter sp. A1]RXV62000.1 ABC transporter ATP-binding protein [Fusibacter sp. A1]